MSELEQNTAIEEAVKEPQVTQDEKKIEQAVPYSRFTEVVKERNQLKSKMENINLEQEEQRKNSLAEQGEYKTLLTEEQNKNVELSKQFEEISTAFNGYVTEERNALLNQIPESKREKFEKVEDLTLLRTITEEFNQKAGVNVGNVENEVSVQKFKGNPFGKLDSSNERRKSHNDLLSHYLKKR
tara:strand:+ start:248 stop:799 length:552 start_codon:yes stop_codon:yes gene_type:complete